jgi:hypothetical protein
MRTLQEQQVYSLQALHAGLSQAQAQTQAQAQAQGQA